MTGLLSTAATLDAANPYVDVRVGWPADRTGWVRCADVDAAYTTRWEQRLETYFGATYGRSDPQPLAGYVLDYYASVPAAVGGAALRLTRRVPRLDPASLAFRLHPDWHHPYAVALLDDRFWCLPGDPARDDPAATVVADEPALGAVLRGQLREHADAFLATYAGAARLPRRHRLGAFFDSLESGMCRGGCPSATVGEEVVGLAAAVLPGGVAEYAGASTVHLLHDERGRRHLSQRRRGCCHHYRLTASGEACINCPRTPDEARVRRYARLA